MGGGGRGGEGGSVHVPTEPGTKLINSLLLVSSADNLFTPDQA